MRYLISIKPEERQIMRKNPNYHTNTIDTLTQSLNEIGAKLELESFRYVGNVEYQGSLSELKEHLEAKGFDNNKIRISLSDTLPIVN